MSKVVIVTGGSRGIGAATALLAAKQGYAVCVNYQTRVEAADTVVEAVESEGGRAIAVAGDVSSAEKVVRIFEETEAKLGPVTALVNNAGILEQQMRVEAMTPERWSRVLAINVIGSFLCAREAVKRMSTKSGGSGGAIVNVSSMAAKLGAPGEYVDYAASKAAVDALTIGLAKGSGRREHPSQCRASGRDLHGDSRQWRRARSCGAREGIRSDETRRKSRRGCAGDPLVAFR